MFGRVMLEELYNNKVTIRKKKRAKKKIKK